MVITCLAFVGMLNFLPFRAVTSIYGESKWLSESGLLCNDVCIFCGHFQLPNHIFCWLFIAMHSSTLADIWSHQYQTLDRTEAHSATKRYWECKHCPVPSWEWTFEVILMWLWLKSRVFFTCFGCHVFLVHVVWRMLLWVALIPALQRMIYSCLLAFLFKCHSESVLRFDIIKM